MVDRMTSYHWGPFDEPPSPGVESTSTDDLTLMCVYPPFKSPTYSHWNISQRPSKTIWRYRKRRQGNWRTRRTDCRAQAPSGTTAQRTSAHQPYTTWYPLSHLRAWDTWKPQHRIHMASRFKILAWITPEHTYGLDICQPGSWMELRTRPRVPT